MKQELDNESRAALVAYRFNRAKETLAEAALLADNNYYNAAVNRLYYACFYATEALLLKHHIQANTHAGVKSMFGLHFVAKEKIPLTVGKTLSTLFEKRQSGDYEDFIYCDKDDTIELTRQATCFVETIGDMLKEA